MKTKYLSLAIAFMVLLAMSACKKDHSETASAQIENDKMMIFKTMEEFNSISSKVSSLTLDQRKDWAKSSGFESFGVKCDDIYFSSHPEKFTTIEEFNALVDKNREFLKLEKLENGEYSLEPALNHNPLRFFANKDRMYQIKDVVYKVLENGTVSTNETNKNKLHLISDENYLEYLNDKELAFSNSQFSEDIQHIEKSTASVYSCIATGYHSESTGNDQTRMWISAGMTNYNNAQNIACSRNTMFYSVKPYKRGSFFLPWVNVSRTISFSISAKVGHMIYGQPPLLFDYSDELFTAANTLFTNDAFDNLEGAGCVGSIYNYSDYGFKWYHCWGDTPSAPIVKWDCN